MTSLRSLMAGCSLAAAMAMPAHAFDIGAMSDAERAQFREEIRAYLLDNPEVLMEAIGVLENRQAEAQATADKDLVAAHAEALFEDEASWVGGNPEGDLVLVEFMDYRCGYCKKAYDEVSELVESDGNIRFVVKEFPILGEESVLAARFAVAVKLEAGDAAYEQVHDALMTLRGNVTADALERVGRDAGIDVDAVMARMEDPQVTATLEANHALAQQLSISGTPTFIMGDEILRGYLPLDAMRQVAEQERAEG
ncbi:DsbA family protein [Mangrovicoccus algicola]|uniref:DsbA family protein n=1 Tax=Mangrovicoccus algicola TaxID=2771008 RepID=A0A8J7CU10_9RHOB|nr:DsbA family protein [Mangrovicoccus algicola]MBE3637049.1 DsbA family protein [Mangrovicoccus algicola]